MTRSELIRSREFWLAQLQNKLFNLIEDYRAKKAITKTALADEFGVTKGYISQLLNGDFDHKLSKMVEISLKVGKVPVLQFEDVETFEAQSLEQFQQRQKELRMYTLNVFETIKTPVLDDRTSAINLSHQENVSYYLTASTTVTVNRDHILN